MTYDNFTIKAQEAIIKGQQEAGKLDQQQVDTVHLLKGIIETDEQLSEFLFQKMDVSVPVLVKKLETQMKKYPRVEGNEKQFLTNDSNAALSRAKKLLPEFGDEFISVELILLGILGGKDKGAQILKDLGVTEKGLKAAILEIRKGSKVDSQSAGGEYNALNKYGINLNERAESGKHSQAGCTRKLTVQKDFLFGYRRTDCRGKV